MGLWCGRASATPCNQAHVFVTGEVLTAATLNANPSNDVICFNNIDNTNIGSNGIFGSQITANSIATATFAGSFGYTFNNGLTVNGGITIAGGFSLTTGNLNVDVTALGTTGDGSQVSASGAIFGGNVKSTNGVFQSPGGGVPLQLCTNACSAQVSASGAFQGLHNACSAGLGLPCSVQATCSLSGGACTITQSVPSGSVCSVSALFETGVTMQSLDSSVSSTTLTAHIAYSGGSSGGINITCD